MMNMQHTNIISTPHGRRVYAHSIAIQYDIFHAVMLIW